MAFDKPCWQFPTIFMNPKPVTSFTGDEPIWHDSEKQFTAVSYGFLQLVTLSATNHRVDMQSSSTLPVNFWMAFRLIMVPLICLPDRFI
jgi:hypothetical protein